MFCLLHDRFVFVFVSYMLTFSLLLLGAMGQSRPSVSLVMMDHGSLVPQGSTTLEALWINTWSLLFRFGFLVQRAVSTDVNNEGRTISDWNCNIFLWKKKCTWWLSVQKLPPWCTLSTFDRSLLFQLFTWAVLHDHCWWLTGCCC